MQIIPKFLRRKPIPTPEPIVEPKKPLDTSYITAIDQMVLVTRMMAVDIYELDCTDKTIYYFLCGWLGEGKDSRGLVNGMEEGLIAPDFTMDDLAIFFRNHIIK